MRPKEGESYGDFRKRRREYWAEQFDKTCMIYGRTYPCETIQFEEC